MFESMSARGMNSLLLIELPERVRNFNSSNVIKDSHSIIRLQSLFHIVTRSFIHLYLLGHDFISKNV